MYTITIKPGAGQFRRPIYCVDGVEAGTGHETVRSKLPRIIPSHLVRYACMTVREYRVPVEIVHTVNGWRSRVNANVNRAWSD
jgi:hypothetical protein